MHVPNHFIQNAIQHSFASTFQLCTWFWTRKYLSTLDLRKWHNNPNIFSISKYGNFLPGPKPCTQLKSTCKTVLDSILNKVIWYMHCGEKSPVNSQLQCFWLKLAKIRYLPPAFLPQILTKSLHSKSYPTQFCKYFSAVYMVLDQKNI